MKREKNLSMTEVLKKLPSPLFSSVDAAKLVPDDNMFLFRAARKGYIRRIANRVYWNVIFSKEPPKVEQVACFARRPSYISCEWAMNLHGVLLQAPFVCTAITLHPGVGKRNRIFYSSFTIEYSKIAERLWLPGEIMDRGGAAVAAPEKALLDAVYLRHKVPFAEELEAENLNVKKLKELSFLYPKKVQSVLAGSLLKTRITK